MTSDDQNENNPLVRGLNTNETIDIGYEAGIHIMNLMLKGLCPMLLLIVGAGVLSILAEGSPAGLLLIVVIYNMTAIVALVLLLLYVAYMVYQTKRTKYFLTNQRLIEVRGKEIVKQIPKTNLQNLEPDQYLKSMFASKGGGRYYYHMQVTDNISGVVILMTSLLGDISDSIERWVNEGKKRPRTKS